MSSDWFLQQGTPFLFPPEHLLSAEGMRKEVWGNKTSPLKTYGWCLVSLAL